MSKKIDERVVEMRFDNQGFESNVKTSMSTIDKLKQKLNFDGAGKGLEKISSAAKKVDMNSLGNAVESVRVKFSALDVIGVTALGNITNAAVNAGKNIAKALTIDPILTGFQEYETQMNAVQTILANTQSKGTNIDQVNAALAELNKYADQTIYNFTEMTRNIGTFTAAGVDLDLAVSSIKGIANLAAVSGSSSMQASTAMYQLSQAIAAGKVQLMDWNSVVNAGMGGELFQNALKRTAEHFGTNVDAMIKKYGSFRESLTKGEWLTTEVLTETLTQLSGAYSEADLIAQGYTEKQAKEIVELANTAVGAATDIKTFTGLIDTMKESVQSGWAQSWQLIIGDFEEAKGTLTEIGDLVGGVIQGFSDARNNLLSGALDSNWDQIVDQIEAAGVSVEDFNNAIKETAKASGVNVDSMIEKYGSLGKAFQEGAISSDIIIKTLKNMAGVTDEAGASTEDMTAKLEKFQKVVDQVWKGDFSNGAERIKALTEAGYDYAEVQELVNKTTDGHRLTLEDLSESQLKSIGYTDEEITKLKELAAQAEQTGTPLNDLIANITRPSGRELLWDTVITSLKSLIDIGKAVGDAFKNAFGDNITSSGLYNLIDGANQLAKALAPTEKDLQNITSTFKGLFAVIDIFTTIIGGGLKVGLKLLGSLLGNVDLGILDVTAAIGEGIAAFRDFLFENNVIIKGLESLAEAIGNAIRAFFDLPMVQSAIDALRSGLSNLEEVGRDIVEGLKNGIQSGISSVPELLAHIGELIINAIKGVLGIHSPSTVMHEIGENTIQGLLNGLQSGVSAVLQFFQNLGLQIKNLFSNLNIDTGKIFAFAATTGLLLLAKQMVDIVDAITAPLAGLGSVLGGVGEVLQEAAKPIGKVIKNFGKILGAQAFAIRIGAISGAVKDIAIAIGILAASIYVLSSVDTGKLWGTIGAIGALAAIILVLSAAVSKMDAKGTVKLMGFGLSISMIAGSLITAAISIKILETMDPESMTRTLQAFVVMVGTLGALVGAFSVFTSGKAGANINKLGGMMIKLSVALLLMVAAMKILGGMEPGEMIKGGLAITAFVGIMALLGQVTKIFDTGIDKLGGTMIKLAVAMGLMVIVIKMIAGLEPGEILKGGAAILGFVYVIGLLAQIVNKYGKGEAARLGTTLLGISASMLIMVAVVKLMGNLSLGEILKGGAAILAFTVVIGLLVGIVKKAGSAAPRISATLIAMSLSIGILAGVAMMLSLISIAGLAKGIIAIGLLASIMAGLVYVTQYAKAAKAELVVITVAIGIMAAAIAALSFIDPASLAGATAAMAIVMGMFALIVKSAGAINGGMAQLIVMTTAVAILGGLIIAIAQLPIESALAASASLSMLLVAMTAAMTIASKAGTMSLGAIVSIGLMTAVVAALALIIGYLSGMQNVNTVLPIAQGLSLLLLALSAATAILSVVGAAAPAAIAGALALDGVIVAVGGLMVAIGALATYFPAMEQFLDKGITLLSEIGYGLGNFFGSVIGGFSAGIASGLPEIGTLMSEFMTNIQPFIQGASGIDAGAMSGVKSLAEAMLIITGAGILESATSWLTGGSSLTQFAEELVPFGESMKEFSTAIAGIDPSLIQNTATAAKALAEMASAIPNSGGLIAKFTGDNSLAQFAEELVPFGEAMSKFSTSISGIDPGLIQNTATAGQALAEMASSIPNTGGLIAKITGDNSLSAFADELVPFGTSMKAFSESIAGIDPSLIQNTATAAQALTEMAEGIPNTGGLVSKFTGDNSLTTFAMQLVPFGVSMKMFSMSIAGIDPGLIQNTTMAAQSLAAFAESIPDTGGLKAIFTGDNNIATFGASLVSFGQSFSQYASSISGIDANVLNATTSAAQSLAILQSSLGEDKLFTNEVWLDDFGKMLKGFGKSFADFYYSISEVDVTQLATITSGITNLTATINTLSDFNPEGLDAFKQSIDGLGDKLSAFMQAFVVDNITTATTNISSIVTALNNMSNINVEGVSTFRKALEDLGTVSITNLSTSLQNGAGEVTSAINGLVTSITSSLTNAVSSVSSSSTAIGTSVGQNISNSLNNSLKAGLSGSVSTLTSTAKSIATSTVTAFASAVSSSTGRVRSAGTKLVSNFASGIRSSSGSLRSAASSAANAAVNAFVSAVTGASARSTSAGRALANGLANGIRSSSSAVTRVVSTLMTTLLRTITSENSAFMRAGQVLATNVANGINSRRSNVNSAVRSLVSGASSTLRGYYGSFYSAGVYLCQGLANGISAGSYTVRARAAAMASAAARAARAALDINSPSKVFYKIGDYAGQGFVHALTDYQPISRKAASGMGESAKKGLSAAISKIQSVIDTDIDMTPTIRPVVDLGDVYDGVETVDRMLNRATNLNFIGKASSINRMMNQGSQVASFDDVVDAINSLNRKLDDVGGTSYNINGITYDDGTNISEAVQTLVRAARVERRI